MRPRKIYCVNFQKVIFRQSIIREFCADLKAIYRAVSISEAENVLAILNEKWKKQYPSAVRIWNDNFIYVQRIFEYPFELRKMLYTTNTIESFNSALRKVTDRKASFPNEMAVMKILYLRTHDVVKKWTMPYPNWSIIRSELDLCGVTIGICNISVNVYTIGLTRLVQHRICRLRYNQKQTFRILHRKGTLFNFAYPLYQTRYDYFYVPTDFDTKEKALSGAKAAEKGLK